MTNPAEYITGRTVQEQMNSLISYVDTRAAEVATSAIASDVADVQQAKTDAEAARDAAILAKDTAVATVANCVTLNTAQNITAEKTFEKDTTVENTNPFFVVKDPEEVRGTPAATDKYAGMAYSDKNGTRLGGHAFKRDTNGDAYSYISVYQDTVADNEATIGLVYKANGDYYGSAPTYPAGAPSDAIATQGNLDNYAAMVRTSGNQNVAGTKTFTSPVVMSGGHDASYFEVRNNRLNTHASAQSEGVFTMCDGYGNVLAALVLKQSANGTHTLVLNLLNSDDSTQTSITLGTSS